MWHLLFLPFSVSSYANNYCQADSLHHQTYTRNNAHSRLTTLILIRHGDRAPHRVLPHDDATWDCSTVETTIFNWKESQTQSVPMQKTHGTTLAASPFVDAHFWKGKDKCPPMALTSKGAQQLYELGKTLGEIYRIKSDLDIAIRSTDTSRTLQSAHAFIKGFFESNQISKTLPIPIETVPFEWDHVLPNPKYCPRVSQLLDDIDNKHHVDYAWAAHQSAQDALAKRLDSILDPKQTWRTKKMGVFDYFDILTARTCHNMSLPCSKEYPDLCVTNAMRNRALDFQGFVVKYWFRLGALSKEMNRIGVGMFMGQLTDILIKAVSQKVLPFYLFSVHDFTLAPILGLLEADISQMGTPPFASNLIIELWDTNSSEHEKYVRIYFNGHPVITDWCNFEYCPLDVFVNHVSEYVPEDQIAECAAKPPAQKRKRNE